jgi:hypothetical protein
MAYEEAPHNVFTGLGEPDSTKFNPETGDSSYHYSGTVPKGIQSILGTISGIGGLLGFGGRGVTEGKPPPANMNNLNQPIYNVSALDNQNDYNQTQMANESYDPSIQPLDPNGVSFDPSIMSDYDRMMGEVTGRYGQSPEQMENIMNRISHHETGPSQRMEAGAIQEGGGPGRGLFQFETGEGQGGMTAMRRMRQYYKDVLKQDAPEWTEYNPREGVDASKLTPEQQKMLFMANTRMGANRTFEGVDEDNLANWWNQYHYAGPENKMNQFHESMADYDITNTAENQAFNY